MSDQQAVDSTEPANNSQTPHCHICGRAHSTLQPISDLSVDLQNALHPVDSSDSLARVCPNCVRIFQRAQAQLRQRPDIFSDAAQALPTPVRMEADSRFTGRGVTIAFLDSGFYAHKDLTEPANRILAYHSIFAAEGDATLLYNPDVASWHGMMTSVVAAGNGFLSDGLYRGIAPDANVVLVKIGKTGHIPETNIEQGLRWVLDHKDEYAIRIVNISAGGDFEETYLCNPLCKLVEEAVETGLTVVCAVGNAGLAPGHPLSSTVGSEAWNSRDLKSRPH